MATISGFVFEGGGTGSECFLTATGFLVLLEVVIEDGVDAIFLVFSPPFAIGSVATDFLGAAESFGFCFEELRGLAGDLLLANPDFVSGFLAAMTLDFAGFATTFVETLALVAEGQLGTFAVAGPGDAVGDGAVVEHARDQEALAGKETHGCRSCGGVSRCGPCHGDGRDTESSPRFSHARACAGLRVLPAGCALAIIRFSLKSKVGGLSSPFFLVETKLWPVLGRSGRSD